MPPRGGHVYTRIHTYANDMPPLPLYDAALLSLRAGGLLARKEDELENEAFCYDLLFFCYELEEVSACVGWD